MDHSSLSFPVAWVFMLLAPECGPMYAGELTDLCVEDVAQPEARLPLQFFSECWESAAVEGERRLLIAVLEDALHCFQKYAFAVDARSQRLFREAEEWFMQPDTGAAFTFEYICETRGLDPESVRSGLRRWCERRIAGTRPQRSGVIVSATGDADGASSLGGLPKISSVSCV